MKVAPSPDELPADANAEKPRFSTRQFLQQLFFQFLSPFSIPLAALFCSRGFALNLCGLGRGPSILSRIVPALIFITIGAAPFVTFVAFAFVPTDSNTWLVATLRSDVIHVVVAFISLRLAVAIKYAFLPHDAYARRLSSWAPAAELSSEQLVTGWRLIDAASIAREVDIAASARYEDAHGEAFTATDAEYRRILAVLRSDKARAVLEAAAGGAAINSLPAFKELNNIEGAPASFRRIPVTALSNALILAAVEREAFFNTATQVVLRVVAVVGTFSTTVIRACVAAPPLGKNIAEALVIVTHWVANVLIMGVTFTFLVVGAIDHRRRARSHALLGELFERGHHGRAPALSFHSVAQVRAFLATRGVLIAFGAAFHERLVIVTSAALVVFIAVSLYCLLALSISSDMGYIIASFIMIHVLVAPALLCVALGLYAAATANEQMRCHVSVIVAARVRLRAARALSSGGGGGSGGNGGSGDKLWLSGVDNTLEETAVLGLLMDVERLIAEEFLAHPISILGMSASYVLLQAFFSAWATLETAAISIFYVRGSV